MQTLRDAATAELAAEPADGDGAAALESESDADDGGAVARASGDSSTGEGGGLAEDPEGWDPSAWWEEDAGLGIGMSAMRAGVDMGDLWQLPGLLEPPDVAAALWPRVLRALDVLCRNVLRQMDVRPAVLRAASDAAVLACMCAQCSVASCT